MSEKWVVGDVLEDDDGFEFVVVGEEGEDRVASVWKGVFEDEADVMARARLIAAAPALRDALRAVLDEMPTERLGWCWGWRRGSGYHTCGTCPGCLAWQAAHDALAMCEEEVTG